ncbi:hypothetical protein PENSPDRAFT_685110 [Peniophora sp. CONT]|nr:hypothetical protein PENSPDRAFT_685110 [Peniophora sp. CONT]
MTDRIDLHFQYQYGVYGATTINTQLFDERDTVTLWRRILYNPVHGLPDKLEPIYTVSDGAARKIRAFPNGRPNPPQSDGDSTSWTMDYDCNPQYGNIVRQGLYCPTSRGKTLGEYSACFDGLQVPFIFRRKDDPENRHIGIPLRDAREGHTDVLVGMNDSLRPRVSTSGIYGRLLSKSGALIETRFNFRDTTCGPPTNRDFVERVAGWVIRACEEVGAPIADKTQVRIMGVVFVSKGGFQPILQAPLSEPIHRWCS